MKTRSEVDALAANWEADPCFDLEEAEGFEEYRDELLAYRRSKELSWAKSSWEALARARSRRSQRARELGCSVELVAFIETLEARLERLEGRTR